MDPNEAQLLAEQIRHTLDLLAARLDAIDARLTHLEEINHLRLAAVERAQQDHETRLRAAADSVIRLNTLTGLAQAGQAAFALLLSALAAWLGSRP